MEVDRIAECNIEDGSGIWHVTNNIPTISRRLQQKIAYFLYTIRNIGSFCGLSKQETRSIIDEDTTTIMSDRIACDLVPLVEKNLTFCPTDEKATEE